MKRQERKETANKGFSLVELIIVVAIMAILIGVLAPQYMRYVERSRNSSDSSNCTAMESAVQVWGAETIIPAGSVPFGTDTTGSTITVTQNADIAFAGANAAALQDALENAGIDLTTRCASRTAFQQYVITVTVGADGVVAVSNNIP